MQHKSREDLLKENEYLKREIRLRDVVIDRMKHEVGNAISHISLRMNRLEIVEGKTKQVEVRRVVKDFEFIEEILDRNDNFSQLESQPTWVDIHELFHSFSDAFSTDKDVIFRPLWIDSTNEETYGLDSKHTTSKYFYIDEIHVLQILYNLLSNAEKYTESGEILFVLSVYREYLSLLISDSGLGIQSDETNEMFQLYKRGLTETNGKGIGLAVVRQIIDLYKGEIEVEENENGGTSIYLIIPASPKTVIYFDDFEGSRLEMEYLFEREFTAWTLHTFKDTSDWKSRIRQYKPDIVLLDIDIAPYSGHAIINKAKELFPDVTFIAYTSNKSEEYKDYFRTFAFDGFIGKDGSNIANVLRECFSRVGTEQSLWFYCLFESFTINFSFGRNTFPTRGLPLPLTTSSS